MANKIAPFRKSIVAASLQSLLPEKENHPCGGFSVRFDIHDGPTLEAHWPGKESRGFFEGIEFCCLCSGFHLIDTDVVTFIWKDFVGVAVFVNTRTDNISERRARMRAIGCLFLPSSTTITNWRYLFYSAARALNEGVPLPNRWEEVKHRLESEAKVVSSACCERPLARKFENSVIQSAGLAETVIGTLLFLEHHVLDVFGGFARRRNILLYSPPPVFCTTAIGCLLTCVWAQVGIPESTTLNCFVVGLCDLDRLASLRKGSEASLGVTCDAALFELRKGADIFFQKNRMFSPTNEPPLVHTKHYRTALEKSVAAARMKKNPKVEEILPFLHLIEACAILASGRAKQVDTHFGVIDVHNPPSRCTIL